MSMSDLFALDLFADISWSDEATATPKVFDAIAHSLDPVHCVLPVAELTNLFGIHSWYALGVLYGINRDEFLRDPSLSIQVVRDRLLDSPIALVNSEMVCLASKVNPLTGKGLQAYQESGRTDSVTDQYQLDARDRIIVPLKPPTDGILDGRCIKGKKHRKSTFLRKQTTLEGTPSDDGLSPQHLIVSNSMQLLIQPINEKGCSILAKIAYRNRPTYSSDRTFHAIGVLRLDRKRVLYSVSNEELGRVQPDIRLRLLTLLKGIGLIPNAHLKDANLPGKGARTSFYDAAMQQHLGVSFEIPSSPTQPYTVASDNRSKPVPQYETGYHDRTVKAKRKHSQIARFTTDSAKDAAINSLFNRAVNAERKLKRERAIADSLYQDVRSLTIAVTRL